VCLLLQYLNYVRALRFDDKPDYAYLRKLLKDVYVREGFEQDNVFDWTMKKQPNAPHHIGLVSSSPLQPNVECERTRPPSLSLSLSLSCCLHDALAWHNPISLEIS
jgi:hypothetical protein